MIISIIAALDQNRGIGIGNQIPWHLPADLKRFKRITLGHHLIMGSKTYLSIGKPLPGRQMIALSRNPEFQAGGCFKVGSLEDALEYARSAGEKEVFIAGGGEVFRDALTLADRLYLTYVETSAEADTYFPRFDEANWTVICQQVFPADDHNPLTHTFKILVRKVSE
jgi:dihydrofolate reductase